MYQFTLQVYQSNNISFGFKIQNCSSSVRNLLVGFDSLCMVWHEQLTRILGQYPAKTGFRIFVVVMPKEDLAGTSLAKPSFGMAPTIKVIIHEVNRKHFCGRCHTKGRLGRASFGMTATRTLRPVFA